MKPCLHAAAADFVDASAAAHHVAGLHCEDADVVVSAIHAQVQHAAPLSAHHGNL